PRPRFRHTRGHCRNNLLAVRVRTGHGSDRSNRPALPPHRRRSDPPPVRMNLEPTVVRAECLCCLVALCWVSPAAAQPLFHFDRAYTITLANKQYGFVDVVQTPGGFRWTEFWFADHRFEPAHHWQDCWVLAIPPVGLGFAFRYLTRP